MQIGAGTLWIVAAGLLSLGSALAQTKVETISPEEANRPLTFSDWCSGIKGYDAARCASPSSEDQQAFESTQSTLGDMEAGAQARGCEGNPDPSVRGAEWSIAGRDCGSIEQPTSDLEPFRGPK